MDFNKGFSAEYYATFVDPRTWADTDRFEITGGSISNKDSDLRQSADIDCVEYTAGERWVRVYLDARQSGDITHNPLITGLSSCPEDDIDGNYITNSLEIYSVLKPCEDVLLPRGWYAPRGSTGAGIIKTLLSVSPAPVDVEDFSPALTESIVAESGETNLSMTEKILTAIGWRMYIEGNGTVVVCSKANKSSARYDAEENDSIEPKISRKRDWYSCPNVFRAVVDDVSAVARDDSEDSELSTVNRGREIWMEDDSCELNDNESIMHYAMRRLKEEQQVSESVSYDRRYNPDLHIGDWVDLDYPRQRVKGTYEIVSQSIEIGYGAKTSEEVVKV